MSFNNAESSARICRFSSHRLTIINGSLEPIGAPSVFSYRYSLYVFHTQCLVTDSGELYLFLMYSNVWSISTSVTSHIELKFTGRSAGATSCFFVNSTLYIYIDQPEQKGGRLI